MKIPAAFLTIVVIWSTTPLAIKWSAADAPFATACIRMAIGFLFMLIISYANRPFHDLSKNTIQLYLASGLSIFFSMALVYYASTRIPSGWIAVLFGLGPIMTTCFAAMVEKQTTVSARQWFGMLLGLSGLVLVFRSGLHFSEHAILGAALVIIAVAITAYSSVIIRNLSKDQTITGKAITTGGLLISIPLFLLATVLFEGANLPSLNARQIYATLYLAIIGSGIGFVLYYYLLKQVSAQRVSLITLVTPITGLIVGNLVNNEPMIGNVWTGAILICIGLLCCEYRPKIGHKTI